MINNELIESSTLSSKAKGIYIFMASKPEGWYFTIDNLEDNLREGVASISSGVQELIRRGWLTRERLNSGKVKYTVNGTML